MSGRRGSRDYTNLQIVNEQFVETRVGVQVDQVELVLLDLNPGILNANTHLLECLLPFVLYTLGFHEFLLPGLRHLLVELFGFDELFIDVDFLYLTDG